MSRALSVRRPTTATELIELTNSYAAVALEGWQAFMTLREVLYTVERDLGIQLILDPESDADLVDYLGIVGPRTAEGALTGAGIGSLVGLAFRAVPQFVVAGAILGGLLGMAHGAQRVESGWRVRIYYDRHTREPIALIQG